MKAISRTLSVISILSMLSVAAAQDFKKAPDFTAQDEDGKTHSLADYKGKVLVLEFTNPGSPVADKPGCPYMVPRYEQKIMQKLADKVEAGGGQYLSVNSNFYNTAADSKAIADKYGVKHPTLIDSAGTIAKSYGAKTSPHMFVINKDGNIVYEGALNDNASPDVSKDATATPYVELAVAAAGKGEMPKVSKTKSYGCGLKIK
jgi:peroxiredoxin